MYLEENIKLDFHLPRRLQEEVQKTEEYYREGDEMNFLIWADRVEVTAKACCVNGSITEKQLDTIFRKYGWR